LISRMNIVVNEELKAYIDPLTADEHEALERSILAEGCRDALMLWGDVLVDGHNRYGICQKHGLPFRTQQSSLFQSIEDVHLWMIDQHLGRRSVSDFQRGVLALRKREILASRAIDTAASTAQPVSSVAGDSGATASPAESDGAPKMASRPMQSREELAKAARLSSNQVGMIEKIQKQAAPEVVAAVKSGSLSINAAAAVATLPAEEQVAAASAGMDQLKQAAKRVREAKRSARAEASEKTILAGDETNALLALQSRVTELEAENAELRRQLAAWQPA
jgi:hypothetical protein